MKLVKRLAITYIQTKFKALSIISKRLTAKQAFKVFCTPYLKSVSTQIPTGATPINFLFKNKKIVGYRWNGIQTHKILVLHGFGSAAFKFAKYAPLLAKKGYEILAFDAPAHGQSQGKLTNALEYSEMIEAVIKKYGPINGFIAHSFGGLAVSLALENMPHDAETKVVLIAPATETDTAIKTAFEMLKIKNPVVRTEMDKVIFKKSGKPTNWFSIRRAVKNINAQILWIHDEEDTITPWADAKKVMNDKNKNIQFTVTKGLGHGKIYSDTTIKKQIVEFL
jgi:pimeloyl-ACP methyl ester carboxylesterase